MMTNKSLERTREEESAKLVPVVRAIQPNR